MKEPKRYQAKLLFKKNVFHDIPTNRRVAEKRLESTLKKLNKPGNERLVQLYQKVIDEQLADGIIEEVMQKDNTKQDNLAENTDPCHYLPHQAVIKESSESTLIRLVLDGSSHEAGKLSLNQHLHSGPCLLTELVGILIRFRMFPIIISGDISRAFHQIMLHPSQRDLTRFLWKQNADVKNKTKIFKSNRIPFGLNISPFILNATLKYHIAQQKHIDQKIIDRLTDSYYCDDLVYGVMNVVEAKTAYYMINEINDKINFKMTKWNSNDKEVKHFLESVDNNYVERHSQSLLGLTWDTILDSIKSNFVKVQKVVEPYINDKTKSLTKRTLLSVIAMIYDPLGMYVPFLLKMKVLFQKTCIEKIQWDDPIPNKYLIDFQNWAELINDVSKVEISRNLNSNPNVKYHLRGYSDASLEGYAATIYLITSDKSQNIKGDFLICKGRIKPLTNQSVPRLELLGAVLLTRLMKTVREYMREFELGENEMYSDSTVILCWIKGEAKNWTNFVCRRVEEIHASTKITQWGYVESKLNKSDFPTRGIADSRLKENSYITMLSNWYTLNDSELKVSLKNTPDILKVNCSDELRKTVHINVNVVQNLGICDAIDIKRFSTYPRLMRVTCKVLHFVNCLKRKVETEVQLMCNAELLLLRSVQATVFHREIKCLKSGNDVSTVPLCRQLKLFIDNNLIVRCSGRLAAACVSYDFKCPILLPTDSLYTKLLVIKYHTELKHAGLQQTLAAIRERYWIPKGRRLIRHIIQQCTTCIKIQGKPLQKIMAADLPTFRVEQQSPFHNTSLDWCGPFVIKLPYGFIYDAKGKIMTNLIKVYVLLFTCCVTRNIQLEVTSGMSAEAFIQAFRRFVSDRGVPSIMYSDNFSTFPKVHKDLKKVLQSEKLKDYLSQKHIEWRYSLQLAPHWNGMSERLIAVTKKTLRKILMKSLVDYEEFHTVLKEAAAIINSRPLSYNYYDLDSVAPLTPSMLMYGRNITQLPELNKRFAQDNRQSDFVTKRLRHIENLKIRFWDLWKKDYLIELSERHARYKRAALSDKVVIGGIYLLKDDKTPRLKWKLCTVTRTFPGRDGKVRSVEIRAGMGKPGDLNKTSLIKRSPECLIPLEISSNPVEGQ